MYITEMSFSCLVMHSFYAMIRLGSRWTATEGAQHAVSISRGRAGRGDPGSRGREVIKVTLTLTSGSLEKRMVESTVFSGKTLETTMDSGKTMENHHFWWDNYGTSPFLVGKLWNITIFGGKIMEIIILSGKTIEHHHQI